MILTGIKSGKTGYHYSISEGERKKNLRGVWGESFKGTGEKGKEKEFPI